jgi:hypothetical protein
MISRAVAQRVGLNCFVLGNYDFGTILLGLSYGSLANGAMSDGVSQDRSRHLNGHTRVIRRE